MSEGTAVSPFSRLSPRLLRKHSAWHIRHIPLTQNFHPQPLAPARKADWVHAHCKTTSNYRKSYIGMEKTDPTDAYLIAYFGRVGRTKKLEPWRGEQFIALKRLTRLYAPF